MNNDKTEQPEVATYEWKDKYTEQWYPSKWPGTYEQFMVFFNTRGHQTRKSPPAPTNAGGEVSILERAKKYLIESGTYKQYETLHSNQLLGLLTGFATAALSIKEAEMSRLTVALRRIQIMSGDKESSAMSWINNLANKALNPHTDDQK
jgi:hypothetical protein